MTELLLTVFVYPSEARCHSYMSRVARAQCRFFFYVICI